MHNLCINVKRKGSVGIAAGLAAFLALTASAYENSDAFVERLHRISFDYETPHTTWAKPYAGGTIRVLYAAGSGTEGMETHARELVEFAQRFDARVDAAYWIHFYQPGWAGGVAAHRRLARLIEKPYDVFVFQDVSPTHFPTWPWEPDKKLREQVRKGAGVVLLGADDGAFFPGKTPLEPLPAALTDLPGAAAWRFGEGRLVRLPPRPVIAYGVGWEAEYDRWQARLGRAVLWAAGREPAAALRIETPSAGAPATAAFSWKPGNGLETLTARVRTADGDALPLETRAPPGGTGRAAAVLPPLREGTHFVEAWLTATNGIRDWAFIPFETTAGTRVTELAVLGDAPRFVFPPKDAESPAAVRTGAYAPFVEPGGAITGRVSISGPLGGKRLELRLVDRRGRILARETKPAAAESAFAFKAEAWMPMLLRVEAAVLEGERELSLRRRDVRVTDRGRGRYHFVLWDFPVDQTLAPYAAERLVKMGVTAILSSRPPPLLAAAYDLPWIAWTGGNVNARDAEEWGETNSNGYFEGHVSRARPHGVLAYSLGDEGATAGAGRGPKTDAGFRVYLKEEYGSVAALNRAWGTAHPSFEAVTYTNEEKAVAAAGGAANLAPAYDRFAFRGWNFVRMGTNLNNRLRARDPQAVIGFEGSGDLARHADCDPEWICRSFGMWVPYVGSGDEFVRSVAPREFIRGNWMGYHRDPQGHLGRFWRCILNGADSTWYWMWSSVVFEGFQRPDLAGGEPSMDVFVEETRPVREGLGDLLLRYELQHDGIAVLYSFPTRFVADQTPRNASYGPYWETLMAWQNVIQDLNMQFNYVTEDLIVSGELAKKGYKALVLPQAYALGPAAAEAIRAFAEAGGAVIADLRPGLYDEHGAPREAGALDGLFGVRGGWRDAVTAPVSITGTVGEAVVSLVRPSAEQAAPARVDPGLELTDGKALGTAGAAPVCIVRSAGRGRAVLLNLQLASLFPIRGESPTLSGHTPFQIMPKEAGLFFQGLFRAAGAEAPFRLAEYKHEGPYMGYVKVQRWRSGGNEIVAFLREADTQTRAASVSIREKDRMPWIYDVMKGVPGGRFNFWLADLEPGRAALFALLPGPLPVPDIALPGQAARGTPVRLRITVADAKGLHAFRVRAVKPDGSAAPFWDRTVMAGPDRPGEAVLPVAWNDPAGDWIVTVTDVFGRETEQTRVLRVR